MRGCPGHQNPSWKAMLLLTAAFILAMAGHASFAQASDIILVKRGSRKTVARLVPGRPISIVDKSGRGLEGNVDRIDKDTLFIRQYDIRRRPTQWGTSVADTLATWTLSCHYRDIAALEKSSETFPLIRNGTIPLVAGTGYAMLHLVNAGLRKEPVDGRTMAIAGGTALAGLLLKKTHRSNIRLDGRYRLEYIDL